MSKKIAATDRMARLIAAIPWIVAQDGVEVDEIVERFDYPRDLLLKDLQEVVFYVGVPPYTPDSLIEVLIEDDMVWIRYADWFSRPMRLSGTEILALLAAGETALGFDTQDEAGPLTTGLAKLRLATGASSDVVDVEFGTVTTPALPVLRDAADRRLATQITYFSFGSNTRTERLIEPHGFFLDQGIWYVSAYCHRAEAERVFRIDRIESVTATDTAFTFPVDDGAPTASFSIDRGELVTIVADSDRAFVFEGVPVESLDVSDDQLTVRLPIASSRWLEQLLLRLGPSARIIDGDVSIDVGAAAARLRERYTA